MSGTPRSSPAGRARSWLGHRGDSGSATVEAALVIPVLVFVLAICLGGISCIVLQVRCIDAAREAARLAGRGDLDGARAVVADLAGNADVVIDLDLRWARARVSARPWGGPLPNVLITAESAARREDAPA